MDQAELRERGDAARADVEHLGRRTDLEDAARRHADALARAAADAARLTTDIERVTRQVEQGLYPAGA
jgi:hypothetical protein